MANSILTAPQKEVSDRSFGLLFTAIFLISAFLFREAFWIFVGLLSVALCFGVMSIFAPHLLKHLKFVWLSFGAILHRVISPLILLVIYIILIIPFGLVMQIFRDPLNRRRGKTTKSYWVNVDAEHPASNMSQQF